jgi:hypothetical protein
MMDKFEAACTAPPSTSLTTTPFDMTAFSTSLAKAIADTQLDPTVMVNTIANAIAKAHTDPNNIAKAVATRVSSGHSTSSLPSVHIFNVHSLPADVCTCYEDHQQGKLILGSVVHQCYANGYYYFMDPPATGSHIFLANSTLYLVQSKPNEKGLLHDPVVC